MNKNKYSFEPVEIKINDLRLHSEIAYLIDRPSFIKKTNELRKKYKLKQPFRSKSYKNWFLVKLGKKKASKFLNDITSFRQSFNYGPNYQDIFKKAVLGCNIENEDYRNTCLINFSSLPYYLTHLPSYAFGILITPQSDKQDVCRIFKLYKKMLKIFKSAEANTKFHPANRIDQKNEIMRDRKWYWERIKGMSYWQIAKKEGFNKEKFYTSEKDVIVKAVKSYKSKLL